MSRVLEEVGCCWLSKLFIIKTRLTVIFLHASDKHILVSICTVEPHKNAHGNTDFSLSVQFVVSNFWKLKRSEDMGMIITCWSKNFYLQKQTTSKRLPTVYRFFFKLFIVNTWFSMFVIASVGTFSTIVHFLEGNCCETMYSSILFWSLCGVRNIPLSCAFRQIILRLKGGISNVFNMYIYGLEVNVITGYPQILKIQFLPRKCS